MSRLLDRIVPTAAVEWGRLTKCWPWAATHDMGPMDVPPGVIVSRITEERRLAVMTAPSRPLLPWRKRR